MRFSIENKQKRIKMFVRKLLCSSENDSDKRKKKNEQKKEKQKMQTLYFN